MRKDSSYAPVFQSERIGTITAEESSLALLNGVLTLEAKGQSKEQAMVIVSYAMLRVQQLYTMAEILLYGLYRFHELVAQALNKLTVYLVIL